MRPIYNAELINRRSATPVCASPAQGAATQCYVATSRPLASVSGEYFANCNPAAPSRQQQDAAMARRLWRVSEQLVRGHLA